MMMMTIERKTSDAQQSCSPTAQCQIPIPSPHQPPFQVTLPVHILGMMFPYLECPFGLLARVICPRCAPSFLGFLCTSSLAECETWNSPWLKSNYNLATAKTSVCYQCYSYSESETQNRDIYSMLAETSTETSYKTSNEAVTETHSGENSYCFPLLWYRLKLLLPCASCWAHVHSVTEGDPEPKHKN